MTAVACPSPPKCYARPYGSALPRLRYGAPQADMCGLVRDGFDRDHAVAAAEDFKYAPSGAQIAGLRAYGERWKREREAALSAAAAEPPSEKRHLHGCGASRGDVPLPLITGLPTSADRIRRRSSSLLEPFQLAATRRRGRAAPVRSAPSRWAWVRCACGALTSQPTHPGR